ncbi:MAG: Isoquinoline 1-oxidoreductase subunit [Acidobacteriota bacterium]
MIRQSKDLLLPLVVGGLLLATAAQAADPGSATMAPSHVQQRPVQSLDPPETFAQVQNAQARSVAYFLEAGKVIVHPRCINCHPSGDQPLQGELSEPHQPAVFRGPDDHGEVGMRCQTCHFGENFVAGAVPGHEPWHLAPIEAAWEGLTLTEICHQLKDRERNGDRSLDEMAHHMAEDGLVGWAWDPGPGREPAPGSWEVFAQLIHAWIDSGAHCPDDPGVQLVTAQAASEN